MKGLKGKTAIVTGGSRGIGRAIVAMLLEYDVSVLFTGRSKEKADDAMKEFKGKYKTPVYYLQGNMEEESFCIAVADEAKKLFGRVDYLANNAFPFTAKYIDATRQDWLHSFEAGPIAYATMIAQYVRVHGREVPGAIVNTSSISQYISQPHRMTYNMAKGAVGQITRCTAMDLAPYIRVNSVSPAAVWTDEMDCPHDDPGFKKFHMIDRVIEPEEVAAAVLFLLSDFASAITATDLPVDAGFLAMGPQGWRIDPDKPMKGSE